MRLVRRVMEWYRKPEVQLVCAGLMASAGLRWLGEAAARHEASIDNLWQELRAIGELHEDTRKRLLIFEAIYRESQGSSPVAEWCRLASERCGEQMTIETVANGWELDACVPQAVIHLVDNPNGESA